MEPCRSCAHRLFETMHTYAPIAANEQDAREPQFLIHLVVLQFQQFFRVELDIERLNIATINSIAAILHKAT
eukprot:6196349-Pleurochrysis_carterae.AAC.3